MKLYSFPYLIQKEVLQHLTVPEVITFSQCSKKHKSHIQIVLKTELARIKSIRYKLEFTRGMGLSYSISTVYDSEKADKFLGVQPPFGIENLRAVRMNVFGKMRRCCLSTTTKPLIILSATVDAVMDSIGQQIFNFFGDSVYYEYGTDRMDYQLKIAPLFRDDWIEFY